jgi:hypothetical protein
MKHLFLAAAATLGLSTAAQAAVLDFGAEAENNGERGLSDSNPNLTLDGVNLYITANKNGQEAVAYLDGPGGGGPTAGLGVCGTLDSNDQCDPSNDDNVTITEDVTINFVDGPFDVRTLSFKGEGHVDFDGNDVNTLLINSVEYTFAGAVAAAIGGAFLGLNAITFAFGGSNPDQFYISAISDVPLPAALPLLLSGVAGLGFAARRRKA